MYATAVVGDGKYRIEVNVFSTDNGLIFHMLGGEKPHVGAVLLYSPGQTPTINPLPEHKDHLIAQPLAEMLIELTGQPVAAVAGVHVDNATPGDLEELKKNTRIATDLIMEQIKRDFAK